MSVSKLLVDIQFDHLLLRDIKFNTLKSNYSFDTIIMFLYGFDIDLSELSKLFMWRA